MIRTQKFFMVTACLLLLIAAQLGALGSHAFNEVLTPQQIVNWQLAVQYQMVHAIGMLLVAWLIDRFPTAMIFRIAGWLLFVGILLFCGSIYISSFIGKGFISALAPFGGSSFMLAWLLMALGIWRN